MNYSIQGHIYKNNKVIAKHIFCKYVRNKVTFYTPIGKFIFFYNKAIIIQKHFPHDSDLQQFLLASSVSGQNVKNTIIWGVEQNVIHDH